MKALCSADQNDAAEEFFGWGAIWLGDLDPSANDLNEPDSLIGSREALRAQQSCAYEVRFDGLGRVISLLELPLRRVVGGQIRFLQSKRLVWFARHVSRLARLCSSYGCVLLLLMFSCSCSASLLSSLLSGGLTLLLCHVTSLHPNISRFFTCPKVGTIETKVLTKQHLSALDLCKMRCI